MVRWMSGVTMKDRRSCEKLRQGLGVNSIYCGYCKKWIHKRCGVVGNIEKLVNFKCRNCAVVRVKVVDELKQFVLGNAEKVEVVEKFCYLGDVIGKGGGAEEASRARVRCAWGKLWSLRCC